MSEIMQRWSRALTFTTLLAITACGWTERAGDFTYVCHSGVYGVDAPSCEHRLTDSYLLRYGEGSGDHVILALEIRNHGSAALIDSSTTDVVRRIGLNDNILVAQTNSGAIYVAAAHPAPGYDVAGPFTAQAFTARYPNAPPWREVQ